MAGALGRPVWLLLSEVVDWRWGLQGEMTAWYSSMRLFRQSRLDDWQDVMARVAQELLKGEMTAMPTNLELHTSTVKLEPEPA
jgi:hypothetical protein